VVMNKAGSFVYEPQATQWRFCHGVVLITGNQTSGLFVMKPWASLIIEERGRRASSDESISAHFLRSGL